MRWWRKPRSRRRAAASANVLAVSWSLDRPVIPAPHQIVVELWNTVFMVAPWKVKSLIYHCWVTLSSTLLGFVLGTLLGIGLAVAIVHSRLLSKSLMPWIIASQTIPILAIAPMVIVVLGSVGLTGLRAEIADLHVSVLLPRHHRHGEGADFAGADAARSDAHL